MARVMQTGQSALSPEMEKMRALDAQERGEDIPVDAAFDEVAAAEGGPQDPVDGLDAALKRKGLEVGEAAPLVAEPEYDFDAGVEYTGDEAIASADIDSVTADLQTRRQVRKEEHMKAARESAYSEEEFALKEKLKDVTLPPEERQKTEEALADVINKKMDWIDKKYDEHNKETYDLDRFTWQTPKQIEEAIENSQRSLHRLNSYYNKELNASIAARDFYRGRTDWYQSATVNDPSKVVANQTGNKQYNNSLSFFEDKAGFRDDTIHANTVYLGLVKVMMATMAKKGTPYNEALEHHSDFFDDPVDWEDAGVVTPELESSIKRKLTYEEAAQMVGGEIKAAADRQGFDYDATAIELGQEALNTMFASEQAALITQKDKDSNVEIERVVFDPQFAYDQAQAGQVLLPALLKMALEYPGEGVGYETNISKAIGKISGTVPKDAVGKVTTTESEKAAASLSKSPVIYPGFETNLINLVHGLATPDETVGEYTDTQGDNLTELAQKKLNIAPTGKLNERGEDEAQMQNMLRVGKSLELLNDASAMHKTLFPRHTIGNNSLRKYNQTRNANPTMFKELREAARGRAHYISASDIKNYYNQEITTDNVLDLMSRIQKGKTLSPDKHNQLKYYGTLYSIASIIDPTNTKHGDPQLTIQKAKRNMAQWAAVGENLLSIMFPGRTDVTLDEINQLRDKSSQPINLDALDPNALAEVKRILQTYDRGVWGFAATAFLDAAVHERARKEGKGYKSMATGQLDYTAAGLAFMAGQAGNVGLVKSMGLVIEANPITGEEEVFVGPRKEYMDATKASVAKATGDSLSEESAKKVASLFKLIGNDPSLTKKWGKLPMMVTPYGKHPRTHSNYVLDFLNLPEAKEFKNQLIEIYASEGKDLRTAVEDLGAVHYEALSRMFGSDLLTTIYAMDAFSSTFTMNGESPKFKSSIDGGYMNFGKNKNLVQGQTQEINGKELPIFTGEQENDPLARKGGKTFQEIGEDGKVKDVRFVPKYMSIATNGILAALGHRSESIALDEAVNFIAKAFRGQGLMPGVHNMYDSLSFGGEAALYAWYGMNVAGPEKAFAWDQRKDIYDAAVEQVKSVMSDLKKKPIVDISYPTGKHGAIGFKLDEKYLSLKNQVERINKKDSKDWQQWEWEAMDRWDKIAKLSKDPNSGWTAPETFKPPEGVDGADDWLLRSGNRPMKPITGEQAAALYRKYFDLGPLSNLIKWNKDPDRISKKKKMDKKFQQNKGKKAYFAKSVSE